MEVKYRTHSFRLCIKTEERKCVMAIRVLVVIDLDFRFGDSAMQPGTADFTFNTLVSALTGAGMQVTKAYRPLDAMDMTRDSTADIQNFTFAGTNLLNFDVIWMIGRAGRNDPTASGSSAPLMADAELTAIAQFMEAGGGVFATGDHDSIGATMCGNIPRVRAMRTWFGQNDGARPAGVADLADNFPVLTEARADTTRTNPAGIYTENPAPFIWFQNQSDSVPQPITPTSPTHPVLRHNGADILVYPDHMHEGRTLGDVMGHNYAQNSPFGDTTKPEFRTIAGHLELPQVIATGTVPGNANFTASGSGATDMTIAAMKTVNTLSVYEGRVAGLGRIVTGSTFHHYVDINLTGDSTVVNTGMAPTPADKVGHDAMKTHGFNDNMAVFDQIKAVYVNITNWLARPRPAIGLILERSTFSQAEAPSGSHFDGAILLTVDGLKPTQFPGGGIPALGAISGMPAWVPAITVAGAPIAVEPMSVSSDDATMPMPDRLQRFTFKYRVRFTGNAFTFPDPDISATFPVQATLSSSAVSGALTDSATLVLTKSANPFMRDLDDGNDTTWLSSDIKVFRVVAGDSFHGQTLPANATRDQALTFINTLADNISSATFSALPSTEEGSALSSLSTTTELMPRKVYNFALARVRLTAGLASNVRVFFRIFTTQTTAALTYHLSGMPPMPTDGYLKTAGADPIAMPGTQNGGADWLSFPMFARTRTSPQVTDGDNVHDVSAAPGFRMFRALIDNNLSGAFLTETPVSGGPLETLPDLIMGEHQCIIAQIEFPDAPIPNGATPWTSDKLSQRNLAIHPVANPGLDASRTAMHTFEIESTPYPIAEELPPDELLLDWSARTPDGTVLRMHLPSWNARDVVELADRFYARHEIEAIDDHTIEIPGGGTRYVPIPMSHARQTGVLSVEFPLGIQKGQRFDVSVRQITNRIREVKIPPPKVQEITLEEAEKIIATLPAPKAAGTPKQRTFDLGGNKVLYTDLSIFDAVSDHALIIEHPDPAVVRAAIRDTLRWREPIGAFQLGVPVSTKGEMLLYHMRLLSVMRWRTAKLPRRSRWRKTMLYYLELLSAKVQALGGNPFAIPATPDGAIPQLTGQDGVGDGDGADNTIEGLIKQFLRQPLGCGLLAIIVLLVVIVLLLLWRY
jgi:hypothetical protein